MGEEQEIESELKLNWMVNQWKVVEKISSGGFGSIYKAISTDPERDDVVAVKTEKRINRNYLEREVSIYRALEGVAGIPRMVWYGTVDSLRESGKIGSCNVLVLEYLGPSLSELFMKNNKIFSLKTVLMIAIQMITRLEAIHRFGIVHRDIKPGNFIMGLGEKNITVYLIDFGLSNFFWINNQHIKFSKEASFRGTHRYASINTHKNYEQSRRDDLEALGYVLIYFLNGKLPWQNVRTTKKDRKKIIGDKKSQISIEELTHGLSDEFKKYLYYVRNLKFEEDPNYELLKSLFRECLENNKFDNDNVFDWTSHSGNEELSTSTICNTLTENITSDLEKKKRKKK